MKLNPQISTIALLTAFSIFLVSCNEDQGSRKKDVASLTITVDSDYVQENEECWAYATDRDGSLLGLHKAINGESFTIASEDASQVNLTLLTAYTQYPKPDSNVISLSFKTFINLKGEKNLRLGKNKSEQPEKNIGQARITVNNLVGVSNTAEPITAVAFSNNGKYISHGILEIWFSDNTYKNTFLITSDPAEILLIAYKLGEPVYLLKKDVRPGDEIEVDFSDFRPHETFLDLKPFKGLVNAHVIGNYSNITSASEYNVFPDGYINDLTPAGQFYSPPFDQTQLGYIEGFNSYLTYINYDDQHTDYFHIGSSKPSIVPPDYTTSIKSNSNHRPEISISTSYAFKRGLWLSPFRWEVYADANSPIEITSIPDELVRKYPNAVTENMKFYQMSFLKTLDDYSFDDFIEDSFSETHMTSKEYFVMKAYPE